MKITVAVRCYNEMRNIKRFIDGYYEIADKIIISDGGSTDGSLDLLAEYSGYYPNIKVIHFPIYEITNDVRWNPDGPHINFVLNAAKEECTSPDSWLIFDDFDDIPNVYLRHNARYILEHTNKAQVNAYRLYMWGDKEFFPKMNGYFDKDYKSLWAWKPLVLDIHADETIRHGTIVGVTGDYESIDIPMCLLHRSWMPDTIDAKVERYNKLELPMNHPIDGTFGQPEPLPDYAREN